MFTWKEDLEGIVWFQGSKGTRVQKVWVASKLLVSVQLVSLAPVSLFRLFSIFLRCLLFRLFRFESNTLDAPEGSADRAS